MSDQEVVKLIGAWPSAYSFRVIWALKLKGISFEYVDEDLSNKSDLLLHHNPIYKRVPVFLHGERSICESTIILQYIDEVWHHKYPLLPKDPYQKALALFWIKYIDDKSPAAFKISQTSGEEQELAVKESYEMLKTIEEHAFVGQKKFFAGDEVGMVDIALGGLGYWVGVFAEVGGIKLWDPIKFPRFQQWLNHFKEAPVIKENLPNLEHMFAFFKRLREKLLELAK